MLITETDSSREVRRESKTRRIEMPCGLLKKEKACYPLLQCKAERERRKKRRIGNTNIQYCIQIFTLLSSFFISRSLQTFCLFVLENVLQNNSRMLFFLSRYISSDYLAQIDETQKCDCVFHDSSNIKLGERGGDEKSKGSVQKIRKRKKWSNVRDTYETVANFIR